MGKKNKSGLGRALIKDRFGSSSGRRNKDSLLHTADLDDGYDWGRLNLQSVTEESSFQEFLSTAQLAGMEFQAEKLNVSFVSPTTVPGVLSGQELEKVQETQDKHRLLLGIPRRPPWDSETSAEELQAAEREDFLDWRRRLATLQEVEGIVLTPYEKNLEFWRQLWRVVERSDIVVQIVDARNPLLFRCTDLEKYVTEVSAQKQNLILMNKADFLTPSQRLAWAKYFDSLNMQIAFFSATLTSNEVDDDDDDKKKSDSNAGDEMDVSCDGKNLSQQEEESKIAANNSQRLESEDVDDVRKESDSKARDEMGSSADGQNLLSQQEGKIATNNSQKLESNQCNELKSSENDLNVKKDVKKSLDSSDDRQKTDRIEKRDFVKDLNNIKYIVIQNTLDGTEEVKAPSNYKAINSDKLLSRKELIALFRTFHKGSQVTPGITTVGLVGYPNVGKSSTINSLLTYKKVSVSATPGKTKHFQTLYLDQDLLLCDCPGLVMPSFVFTKGEMVINGILPIDQMRDHVPPVTLVASLIPRHVLESMYGIMLPQPQEGRDPTSPPTSEELLNAYGYNRGFMTQNGQPDNPRASRYILKDFVNGKLLYCHAPPGCDQAQYHVFPERKKASVGNVQKVRTVTEDLDVQFFQKTSVGVHMKGASGSRAASSSAKPWRDHRYKRNSKEKSRRVYAHLDE